MDFLEALRLQIDWGADEALLDHPQDRRQAKLPDPLPAPSRAAPPRRAAALAAGPAEARALADSCDTLESLRAALTGFTGCALAATATHVVFADGPPTAKIMVIGDAPGADDDRAGRAFAGPAGQLLDRMLASIGLDRTTVRIVNVVPWRPPGDRNPTESEIALSLPFLHRHVALMRPDCLLLLGAVAAKALLAEPERNAGIRRQRGSWRQIQIPGLETAAPALPAYHPAYLLRTPSAKREAWADLLALRSWRETHYT